VQLKCCSTKPESYDVLKVLHSKISQKVKRRKVEIMLIRKILVSVLLATGTLAASLLASTEAVARSEVYIRIAPPVQYVEVVPQYRTGYVWVPGYWDWRVDRRHGGRHVWVQGSWLRERHGYAYRPHRWVDNGGYWVQERGRWDRDGDGVPNRYDRHPYNPYRR
jgi:hypothetical protein